MERADRQLYQSRRIRLLPVDKIAPNPRQPRRRFEEQPLRELADSIRQHGVLQPLTVQRTPEGYVLVAGERRLRAAAMAGLTHVPCILVRATEEDSALLALIENLQRCDLHYLEEAAAIARLITTYGLSQEEAARRLGRSQPAVANKLRLLRLSPECCDLLRRYGLTERHARALLRLEDEEDRLAAARHMGERGLNVAAAEAYVDDLLHRKQTAPPEKAGLCHQGRPPLPQQRHPGHGHHPPSRRRRPVPAGGLRGGHHPDHPHPPAAGRRRMNAPEFIICLQPRHDLHTNLR